jgi:hypothetical protein
MGISLGMKKTNTKLQLKTNTIRVLQTDELTAVHGGAISVAPTNSPTNCSTSKDCLVAAPAQR